jgi:hypothetical protein
MKGVHFMDGNAMSPADIAALQGNDMNGNSWIWFLLIFVLLGWNGNAGRAVPQPNAVTSQEFQAGMNNQSIMSELNQIALSSQNNNYETLQAINGQTMAMTQMNNQNQLTFMNGLNGISSKLDQLGFQMQQCCCEIKTTMLQDRLDAAERENLALKNEISNNTQTRDILNSLGRFVAYAGSGTAAGTVAAAGN